MRTSSAKVCVASRDPFLCSANASCRRSVNLSSSICQASSFILSPLECTTCADSTPVRPMLYHDRSPSGTISRFRRNLVFRVSTWLDFRDYFARLEQRFRGGASCARDFRGDLLEIALGKPLRSHLDFAIGRDQKNRRNGGDTVLIRNGVASGVDQSRKLDIEFLEEVACISSIVLRNTPQREFRTSVCFVQPLKERRRELAGRAADLEKYGNDRPFLERLCECHRFSVRAWERNRRRLGSYR